jgi:DUF4097 and DUF4098 domain-containing protein YvlB
LVSTFKRKRYKKNSSFKKFFQKKKAFSIQFYTLKEDERQFLQKKLTKGHIKIKYKKKSLMCTKLINKKLIFSQTQKNVMIKKIKYKPKKNLY